MNISQQAKAAAKRIEERGLLSVGLGMKLEERPGCAEVIYINIQLAIDDATAEKDKRIAEMEAQLESSASARKFKEFLGFLVFALCLLSASELLALFALLKKLSP